MFTVKIKLIFEKQKLLSLFFNSAIQPILLALLTWVTAASLNHMFLVQQSNIISRITSLHGSFRVTSSAGVLMLRNTSSTVCSSAAGAHAHTWSSNSTRCLKLRAAGWGSAPSLHCSPLCLFCVCRKSSRSWTSSSRRWGPKWRSASWEARTTAR